MDQRHTRRPPGIGELPQRIYPEREKFDPMAGAGESRYEPHEAGARVVVPTVRRAAMVNYPFSVVAADGSQKALSENPLRAYLFIQVKQGSSAGILYVNYGAPADPLHVEIVSASGTYEFPVVPVNSIWLLASTGTMNVVITEGTEVY